MILLDTHVAVWIRTGRDRIGPRCHRLIERGARKTTLAKSAISFWEVALLREKGRVDFGQDAWSWREETLERGLVEIAVDGDIAIRAARLADFHADPADRVIVATALAGHTLVTADQRILSWSGGLRSVDARR